MKRYGKAIYGYLDAGISRVNNMRIPLHAAYASYFLILSLFPFLLLILASLRLVGLRVENLIAVINAIVPSAVHGMVDRLVLNTYKQSSSAIAGVSALAAIWSSSTGMCGMLMGLNAVYDVTEDRGYIYTRFISILYSAGFLAVVLLTLLVHVFGSTLVEFLLGSTNPLIMMFVDFIDLQAVLLVSIQTLLFTVMYMVLPNQGNRFLDSLPGGIAAAAGWQIFSYLYSIYVRLFPKYISIFGSIYTVAISMLWLYICISIVFYGGALNNLLRKFRLSWKKKHNQ